MTDLEQLSAKVRTFRDLHAGPDMLVMANPWDAASAQRFEAAGFPAIATTSGGVAMALGYADHEPCRENGALAPVMMQQSFGVANSEIMALDPDMEANRSFVCRPNPWPFPTK